MTLHTAITQEGAVSLETRRDTRRYVMGTVGFEPATSIV
jgi:hypothetical protein